MRKMNWPTAVTIIFLAPVVFLGFAYVVEAFKERKEED